MVIERRCLFGVDDIAAVVFVCPHCKHETAWRLDNNYMPAQECGACGNYLISRAQDGDDPVLLVLESLRRFATVKIDRKAIIRFVVPSPD